MSITRVQYKHQYVATSGTGYAFTSNNTAGNFIVVGVSGAASTDTAANFTISDSQGNSYTALTISPQPAYIGYAIARIFYAYNIKAGANSVAVSIANSSQDLGFTAVEYSGIKSTADPLDVEATPIRETSVSNTTTHSSSFSPQTGSLIFAIWADELINPNIMTVTGANILQTDFAHYDSIAEKLSANSGSQQLVFNFTASGNSTRVICLACFLPAPVTVNKGTFFQFM